MPRHVLKILVIGNANSSHIQSRAKAVANCGHAVSILSAKNAPNCSLPVFSPAPVSPWPGPLRSLGTFRKLWRLYRLIRAQQADMYHVHFAYGDSPWLTLLAGKSPLVVSTMGADVLFEERDNAPSSAKQLTKLLVRSAGLVTAKTSHMAERLVQLGVKRNHIIKMVWGVDHHVFHPCKADALRKQLDIPSNTPVVISPRSLTHAYNIDIVLKAFSKIRKALPSALLLLCDGNATPDYRQEMLDLIDKLELKDAVQLTGFIPHKQMPKYYNLSNVVLSLAWLTEGMPQSLLEAMACGTPCVATRLERYEEYVTHNHDILLTELNADHAANAVLKILQNPTIAEKLSQNGQLTVQNRADIAKEAQRICAAYDHLNINQNPSILLRIKASVLLVIYILSSYISNFFLRFKRTTKDQ